MPVIIERDIRWQVHLWPSRIINSTFQWSSADPCAVEAVFRHAGVGGETQVWTFARTLLADGLEFSYAGDCDVITRRTRQPDIFWLTLRVPGHSTILRTTAWEVEGFVKATTDVIALGEERAVYLSSMDEELEALFKGIDLVTSHGVAWAL
jgi:Streptomyces sporulation and cell division protein, SsgA